ncbi:maleylpyruvate isomerase N-terminal domain-containing protein [Mycolicibacterium lacusdiani]|jgi:uncharacterized protein (TIGR03083 family)|uniref:maleylpyruvate isomerase N-terminal domain-containing protein n=1 Tax=Mycolicibacterium lacusdiani TaxID=2895283 RepID=UPI001F002E81|nr:maleylpyruvate isomerase N-terminal domain-containing protein [Mycolicibacterium lacusdiani]
MAPTYTAAAEAITDLVRRIPDDAWDGPGLGDWDLRSLVGHASRSFVTVSTYLRAPAEREDLASAVDYVARLREMAAGLGAADVVERGRQAGRDLGADPAAAVDALARAALSDTADAGDPLITVIGGLGIRLSNYLPTRTFELAVHGLDIARAAGISLVLPDEVLEEATVLATRVGVALGHGETVLLALTGRAPLTEGFSVV